MTWVRLTSLYAFILYSFPNWRRTLHRDELPPLIAFLLHLSSGESTNSSLTVEQLMQNMPGMHLFRFELALGFACWAGSFYG